jgi:hypothetical protein
MSFKVGDYLIATTEANEEYSITKEGTIVLITDICNNGSNMPENFTHSVKIVNCDWCKDKHPALNHIGSKMLIRMDFLGFRKLTKSELAAMRL